MRKPAILLIAAFAAACSNDVTAPVDPLDALDTGAIVAYDAAGMSGPGRYLTLLHRLPDDLKLTAEQAAAIRALLEAFKTEYQDDIEALARIHAEAMAARRAGKSREEVAAILARGDEIRKRLAEGEQRLEAAIADVLTAEQKAWLAAHQPTRCDRRTAPQLTEAQATQIRALIADYEEQNKEDIEAVKAALEAARAAQRAGASREEIRAIIREVMPAIERLKEARQELLAEIWALLTPAQRESGCFRGFQPRR